MKNICPNKKIIGSLIFPLSILLIFGICFGLFSFSKELNTLRIGCLFSALFGGFIPLLITLITKTDTCLYLKDRAIVLAISLIFIFMAWLLNVLFASIIYAWCAVFLSVILSTIYFIQKCRTGLERLIFIISNPMLYLTACLICFGYDVISEFKK
ncbi:MAG: hypothetical protein ACI4J1_02340 [Ruminiclostridium sp.]